MSKLDANTGRLATITAVCAIVFYISFNDIRHVALDRGVPTESAMVYPFCIDFMILACALTLVAARNVSRVMKMWAKFGRWFGFAATIYANALGAASADINAVVIHAIPGVSLIVTVELLIHGAKGTGAAKRRRP